MNVLFFFFYFGLYDKIIRMVNCNLEFGSDEMEEELCGFEFFLIWRGLKFGGKFGVFKEIERYFL